MHPQTRLIVLLHGFTSSGEIEKMLRKPNYCCNCGDKVERVEWRWWHSDQYCELCETEFQFDEWWPRGAVLIIVVFGLTGIGFHFGDQTDSIVVRRESVQNPTATKSKVAVRPNGPASPGLDEKDSVSQTATTDSSQRERAPAPTPTTTSVNVVPVAKEELVFCGALTKKGTPCSRKVKGGGHCWQHKKD